MYEDVQVKIRKGNKLLFNRESTCLQPLKQLVEEQTHKALILWALDCATIPAQILNDKYNDPRVDNVIEKGWQWSRGEIKMSEAKKAILSLHKMAKDLSDESDIAYARAVAHAVSTIHVDTHALGLVFYELSGIVRANITDDYAEVVNLKLKYYYEKLQYWQDHQHSVNQTWAKFIVRDGKINKEKLLSSKNTSIK